MDKLAGSINELHNSVKKTSIMEELFVSNISQPIPLADHEVALSLTAEELLT